jgi:ABC-type Fe3+ transport system permease subunit
MPQYTFAVAIEPFLPFSPVIKTLIVYFLIYTPVASVIFFAGIASFPKSVVEYSLTITSKTLVTLKILISHLKNYIITAIIIVFLLSISEFTVPAYFGAQTFSTSILIEFTAFYNFDAATLHSIVLAFVSLLIFIPFNISVKNTSFTLQNKSLSLIELVRLNY